MGKDNQPRDYDENLHRSWVDQFYTEIQQVQQRLNFFLVAISFLFLGFITMITNSFPDISVMRDSIIHLTAFFGVVYSFYSFQINYHQCRVADIVSKDKLTKPLPDDKKKILIKQALKDALHYPFKAREFAKSRVESYAWFIPFGFSCFWLLAWLFWTLGRYTSF